MLIMGYTSFDLGIFDENDVKVTIIKKAIRSNLTRYLDDGLKWLVFTGNLGFEYWAFQIAKELQKDYDFYISSIIDFETHGKNWNAQNQLKFELFKSADFIKFAFDEYENPGQFKVYNDFLLENSDGAFVFYDEENETKLKFMVNRMREKDDYSLDLLGFDELQEIAQDMNDY